MESVRPCHDDLFGKGKGRMVGFGHYLNSHTQAGLATGTYLLTSVRSYPVTVNRQAQINRLLAGRTP